MIRLIIGILLLFFSTSILAGNKEELLEELSKCRNFTDSVGVMCRIVWTTKANANEAMEYARKSFDRKDDLTDSLLIADVYDAMGNALLKSDSLTQAKLMLQKALSIAKANNYKTRSAWTYYTLAQVASAENDDEGLTVFLKLGMQDFKEKDDFFGQRAVCWFFIKNGHADYIDTLKNKLSDRIAKSGNSDEKLDLLLEEATLYSKLGDRNKELLILQQIIELAETSTNLKASSIAYWNIANYFKDIQQNYQLALKYYLKALKEEEQSAQPLASGLFCLIGETYMLNGDDSLALSYLNKGLKISKEQNSRHSISSALMSLGTVSYQSGKYEDAIEYFSQCYNTGCDVCPQITFHDALVKIGNAYVQLHNYGQARSFYQKSLELAKEYNSEQSKGVSNLALGDLAIKMNQNEEAEAFYLKAYNDFESCDYLKGQQECTQRLSNLYHQKEQFPEAYRYLLVSNQLEDTLNKINSAENLAKLETHFDFENLRMQRELDRVRSNEEIARQILLRNVFIGCIIFLALLILVVFMSYKRKKKDNSLLAEQKEAIESMSSQLHQADQAKLNFFTNVSHELKTPLTLILGITEKLKHSTGDNKQLDIIKKNSLRLLQLIDHLLDLRKLDTSNMKLQVAETCLSEFLKGVIASFYELASQKKIKLIYDGDIDLGLVYFDQDKLEKVIVNLLSNAIKFNGEGGWVRMGASVNNLSGQVQITVSDNGIGILQSDQQNIFNRFYRGGKHNRQGSGIGLAYSKELIELHKGKIWVESKLHEGSVFILEFPGAKEGYLPDEISLEPYIGDAGWKYAHTLDFDSECTIEKHEASGRARTILVVEDNHDLRKFISGIFEADFHVIEAGDGEEGVRVAVDTVPDIIISDIVMPKLSGVELVEKVKNTPATSHVPVILLTAKNDCSTQLLGYEKGADEYIGKPFESAILKSRVYNLLRIRKGLVEKFSKQFHLQPREIVIEDSDQRFVQETIDVIEEHMSNPALNIDLLTTELGITRTQLYRKLKALTDFSANQFIRVIRLKRAAQLLEKGQFNIAQVMDETGFNNYSYFNSCFRELYGKTPKEYAVLKMEDVIN